MVDFKDAVFLILMVRFHSSYAQGILDPCYFWPGAVYAGDGKCFLYVDSLLTFQNAKAACEADSATLAEIRSHRQRDVASSVMVSSSSSTTSWLGASSVDGNIKWVSDSHLVSVSQDWWSGSVVPQVNNSDDQCLVMTTGSTLDAQSCGQTFGYICQIHAGNPCDMFLPGAEFSDNHCFLPLVNQVTFDVAVEQCQKRNSFVVEPRTTDLIAFVSKLGDWYLVPTKPSWLGLTLDPTTADLTWTSGDLVTEVNWPRAGVSVTANVMLTSGDAVVMDGAEAWSWRVVSRSSLAQVICQRDLSQECAGLFVSGRCLVYHSAAKSWSDARADCMSTNGSYLAEPKTELLSRSVDTYLLELRVSAHLGGQDIDTPDTFVWDHSGLKVDEGFSNWYFHEPNNNGGKEDVIMWRLLTRSWNDARQASLTGYLCETVVDPVYVYSYVLILPKEFWAGPRHLTDAILYVSTQPDYESHNSIEIFTHPTGQLETRALSGDETFQFDIDIIGVSLDSSGVQHKYILIKSQAPLDVLFSLRGQTLYACITLVFESLAGGEPSSFFSNPSLLYNSIGFISTDVTSASVRLGLSTANETVSFDFDGNSVSTRDNLQISNSLPEQYQSLYVDTLTGGATSASVHASGSLSVFHYGREDTYSSRDATIDQVLPVSLLAKDYVTFPSLPFDPSVTDYYTVVAVYSNTVISVSHSTSSTVLQEITLLWPGDSTHLELPATGFHHVTGNEPFYIYAKMTGADPTSPDKSGRCSVTLLHEALFRISYRLPVVGPMTGASDMFVVVIVRTSDSDSLELVSPDGSTNKPDMCQVVSATQWSGCYFELTNRTSGTSYRVKMTSDSPSRFAAYLFARVPDPDKLLCFQLGLPEMAALNMGEKYDLASYSSIINLKPQCDPTEPTSSPPPDVTQCPVIPNTTEVSMTSAELDEALEQITTHLTVEKSSLSSVKRAKESAPDKRTSSSSMGYFSITFIVVFLAFVIVSDFGKLFIDMKLAMNNIRTLR